MTAPVRIHLAWLEGRIADLWPSLDTAAIAVRIAVPEPNVANTLARMRDRSDPRLRKSVSR